MWMRVWPICGKRIIWCSRNNRQSCWRLTCGWRWKNWARWSGPCTRMICWIASSADFALGSDQQGNPRWRLGFLHLAMSAMNRFTLGLIQMRCEAEPRANLDKAATHIEQAAKAGAEIICLPELFRSHYFCQRTDAALFDLAEEVPGPTTQRFGSLAK